MKRVLTVAAAAAVALGAGAWRPAAAPVPEEGAVTSLSVVPASGRAEVVIGVGGTVSVQDFTLHDPERLVVDISGASLRIPTGGYDQANRGGVLGVRYSQFSRGVVRVVVTLDGPHRYAVAQDSGRINVTVDGTSPDFAAWHVGGASNAVAQLQTPTPAAPAAPAVSDDVPAPVTVQPPARLAASGPVRVADYKPEAQQQPRITMNWENADIRDVVAAFASYSGRTIILGQGVEATKITANITDQPWDVALRVVLNANGLDAVQDPSGILIVDTEEHIAARRAQEPLGAPRSVRLNYVPADTVKMALEPFLTRDCSSTGNQNGAQQVAAPTPASQGAGGQAAPGGTPVLNFNCPVRGNVTALGNTVIITDIASNEDFLVNYAKSLDRPQAQVTIKAKIISVNRTALDALGLQYDIGSAHEYFNDLVPRLDSAGQPQTNTQGLIYLGGNTVAAIANATQTVPGAALKAVYSAAMGGFSFTSFIQALTTLSLLDVQAEPSVTTLNLKQANLTAGTQVPVRIVDASSPSGQQGARATVSYKQTGIILTVTPVISSNNTVQMTVHAENSNVQAQSSDVGFVVPTQSVDNTMLVADGQTAVMGGLTQTSVTVSKSGIPVLMDLPILGRLFGFTQRQETKSDLLILITPHIVHGGLADTGDGGSN
jgi:type IV pilus assembly protein PilQ